MSYLRKLPSGRWRAEVEASGQRESLGGFLTKREAQEWATQTEADLRAGRLGKWPMKTLRQAIERYRDEVTPGKGSEKNERLRLDAFLRDFPALCDKRLTELQPDDLQGWVTTRLKTVKPDTVKRESHTLSNVWTVAAKRWRWVPLESPWANVTIPREGPPRDRRISWREAKAICRALGYVSRTLPLTLSQETALAWLLALRTAMRSGELLGLTAADVDLAARVVRLRTHKTFRYTGRPRFVPVTKQAARLLGLLMASGRDELFRVADRSRDALFRKALGRLGIQDLHFHDARGEALTRMSRRVDILTLQKISGHIDIGQLAAYYKESPADIAKRL